MVAAEDPRVVRSKASAAHQEKRELGSLPRQHGAWRLGTETAVEETGGAAWLASLASCYARGLPGMFHWPADMCGHSTAVAILRTSIEVK